MKSFDQIKFEKKFLHKPIMKETFESNKSIALKMHQEIENFLDKTPMCYDDSECTGKKEICDMACPSKKISVEIKSPYKQSVFKFSNIKGKIKATVGGV